MNDMDWTCLWLTRIELRFWEEGIVDEAAAVAGDGVDVEDGASDWPVSLIKKIN